jgi:hypothetical protein
LKKNSKTLKIFFSLCFLKDNTQINIAIKFNDIYNIRLFDLSGKKIKEIKLCQDNKYCGIESYYDQTQKTSYIIISSENIIKSYDYQQDLVYKKYISFENGSGKIGVDQIKIASKFYDVSVDYAASITEKRKWHEESSL